jgi:hypothetical protein
MPNWQTVKEDVVAWRQIEIEHIVVVLSSRSKYSAYKIFLKSNRVNID